MALVFSTFKIAPLVLRAARHAEQPTAAAAWLTTLQATNVPVATGHAA